MGSKHSNQNEAKESFFIGNAKMSDKQYKEALNYYNQAIELWPENVHQYINRGLCYMKLNEYKAAGKDFKSVLAIDSCYSKHFKKMIQCFLAIGDVLSATKIIQISDNSATQDDDDAFNDYRQQLEHLKTHMQKAHENYKKKDFQTARELN